ncbi:hypothetical protein G6F22_018504 [Rhizopus arrhizus]|nr:hypothetical protein G6F22_018504 [Rhizopus arrhizus]
MRPAHARAVNQRFQIDALWGIGTFHRLARGVAQAQFQQQRCWHAGLRHMRRAGRHQFDVIAADELAIEMDIDVVAARLHRVAHAESRQVFADETTGEAFAEFHFATGSGVCG